jgi:hypothetical protein
MKNIEDVQNKVIVDAVAKDIKKSMRADEVDKRKQIKREAERAAR